MSEPFQTVVQLMARLRAPDGCPWDRKQTAESLKPYLIEETYEVLDALDQKDAGRLREELGDLLLQILFHAQIAAEQGTFTIDDVLRSLAEKLIRRHPHVFGTEEQRREHLDSDEVKVRWERIKRRERKASGEAGSLLDGIPKTLPALLRAFQVQARAARVGFDWPHREGVVEKLKEELQELQEAIEVTSENGVSDSSSTSRQERIESELGDVLFTVVNLARVLKANPEEALCNTIRRFTDRFRYLETRAASSGRALESMTLEEMDALWNEAKLSLEKPG
jgi:tetrapyrrole methylase family protein/MazG family protein